MNIFRMYALDGSRMSSERTRSTPTYFRGRPSAVTFAVTASGLPVDRFSFRNFAPVKPGKRRKFFESIRDAGETCFFFESPYRVGKALADLAEVVGAYAEVALVREATKIHEEVLRGSAAELAALKREWKGEFVIGVHPPEKKTDTGEEAE